MKGFFAAFFIFALWTASCIYYIDSKEEKGASIVASLPAQSAANVAQSKAGDSSAKGSALDTATVSTNTQINASPRTTIGVSGSNSEAYLDRDTAMNSQMIADNIRKTIAISDTIDVDKDEPKISSLEGYAREPDSFSSQTFYPIYEKNELILDQKLIAYAKDLKIYLKEHPTKRVKIIGHSDNIGNNSDNFRTALRKSRQIKWFFTVRNGIPREKVKALSWGERKPIATNKTPEGRKLNDRIEILIE